MGRGAGALGITEPGAGADGTGTGEISYTDVEVPAEVTKEIIGKTWVCDLPAATR